VNYYLPNFRPTDPREKRLQRALEILPGALTWGTFIALAILAFVSPWAMAIFVILFCLYWLLRVLYYAGLMLAAYGRLRRERGIDWFSRAKGVCNLPSYVDELETELALSEADSRRLRGTRRKAARQSATMFRRHLEEVRRLQSQRVEIKPWDSVYHLIVLCTYKEDYDVLETSIAALTKSNFPSEKMIFVLAAEEREGAPALEKARRLEGKFGSQFHGFITTVHPADLPGEVRGKAPNTTWAARQAKDWLDARGIAYSDVVMTVLDADTCVEADYFACLTYQYITRPNRLRCSYQPLPMYHNNIWDAPLFSRMAATITSCWQLVQNTRPDLLVTFSNYAVPFQALVDVDFWPTDIISEDAVIFYRCLMRYSGDYEVVPMFVAVKMDANLSRTYFQTLKSLYQQMRRWAWGAENVPLLIRGLLRNPAMPLRTKIRRTLQLMEVHYTWATAAVILTAFVWVPIWAGGAFRHEILSHNLPIVTGAIFQVGFVGMVISAFLGIALMPPRPAHQPWYRWIWMATQWFLAPIYYLVLASIPAVDAQTRLMFGRYLNYVVTDKHRVKPMEKPVAPTPEFAAQP